MHQVLGVRLQRGVALEVRELHDALVRHENRERAGQSACAAHLGLVLQADEVALRPIIAEQCRQHLRSPRRRVDVPPTEVSVVRPCSCDIVDRGEPARAGATPASECCTIVDRGRDDLQLRRRGNDRAEVHGVAAHPQLRRVERADRRRAATLTPWLPSTSVAAVVPRTICSGLAEVRNLRRQEPRRAGGELVRLVCERGDRRRHLLRVGDVTGWRRAAAPRPAGSGSRWRRCAQPGR